VLELMRQLQLSGAVGMRVQPPSDKDKDQRQNVLLTFRTAQTTPEAQAMSRELRDLLKLDQEETNFRLVVGGTSSGGKEIAVLTRSILHLMQTMASQVDVPRADVEASRVGPGWQPGENNSSGPRLIVVHSDDDRPHDAFVSVRYRGHWFWIDDRDLKTKRTFAFMMLLFTLADTADKETLPLITIPAQ
jgi:hypothetical protein